MAATERDTNQNVHSDILGTDESGTVNNNLVFGCKLKRQNTFSVYLQRKPLLHKLLHRICLCLCLSVPSHHGWLSQCLYWMVWRVFDHLGQQDPSICVESLSYRFLQQDLIQCFLPCFLFFFFCFFHIISSCSNVQLNFSIL